MNRYRAIFNLQEMAVHISSVIDDIRAGRYDEQGDLSFEVALGHLMDHLALAWHESQMTDEEISELSQEQYQRLSNAIPRLQLENRLVEPYEKVV